jgi:guanylate kinase
MVVSAPSGAGKTSICREILRLFPNVRFSVSSTTRPPRPGEVNGKDYDFISEEEFRERIAHGEFFEWVEKFGQLYGTSKKTMDVFLSQGYDLILDIETRGAKAIREQYPRGIFIFLLLFPS